MRSLDVQWEPAIAAAERLSSNPLDRPIIILAVEVLRRAFADLTCREHNASAIRRDAHEFLMTRLWEPDCLWHDILSSILVKRAIVAEIDRRVQVDARGEVLPR